MNRVDFHGEFWFPVPPEQLWVMTEQFDLFTSWWAWLREFRADQAGLAAGNVLHGTVVPPVPCRLRLDVRLQRCDRPRTVEWTAPSLIETRFSQILLSGEVSVSSTVTRGALAQPGR